MVVQIRGTSDSHRCYHSSVRSLISKGRPATASSNAQAAILQAAPARLALGRQYSRASLEMERHRDAEDARVVREHEEQADRAVDQIVCGAPEVPGPLLGHLEARLGHDLSGVRLRTDPAAEAQADRLGAVAFTSGREIAFGRGQYAPRTASGRRLLAHELAHVVQQGAVPRVPGATHAPVAPTGRAPRVQLKDGFLGGKWEPDKVKALIKEKDKGGEMWKAIENNDLKGTPSLFRSVDRDGETHEWWLMIAGAFLDRASPSPGTKKGETRKTEDSTVKRKKGTEDRTYHVHTIPIDVNWILDASPEDTAQFPEHKQDQARVNFMAARTLYHELIHALIRIDEESETQSPTKATQAFQKRVDKLKISPRLDAAQSQVKLATSRLVSATETAIGGGDLFARPGQTLPTRAEQIHKAAEADKMDPKLLAKLDEVAQRTILYANKSDEHVDFLERTLRMFLEEKHARQSAGEAFGQKKYQENSQLVDDYAGQVENTLTKLAGAKTGRQVKLVGNDMFDKMSADLRIAVSTLYNLLDSEPDAPASLGPGMKYYETPGIPRPVDIGGNPVKPK
jgi:hypothetical protein